MELKRYLEADSKTALDKIKSEHGDEALIISSDKIGNKTEVIIGVNERTKKVTEIKEESKEKSDAFRHALEANANQGNGKQKPSANKKNPWTVIEKLNDEIADIRNSMLELQKNAPKSRKPTISEIDEKVKSRGFNLAPIETFNEWADVNFILGKPGSGKTEVLKRVLSCFNEQSKIDLLVINLSVGSQNQELMSLSPSLNFTYMNTQDIKILEKIENLRKCFAHIFIEVDYSLSKSVQEQAALQNNLTMVCSGADHGFDPKEFGLETQEDHPPMILTRLDLCSDLPSKLNYLTENEVKIKGTATGPLK